MSHYLTLGVAETATPEEIKKAFRELAKKYHPDANKGDPQSEAKFKRINEAYEILKDPAKRQQYDMQRQGNTFHFRSGGFDPNQGFDPFDIFGFNQGGFRQNQVRNRDTVVTYVITLEEAFEGKTVDIKFNTGSGTTRTINLAIPRSIHNGTRIRYAGMGEDTVKGVPPGDLYVKILIEPHTQFIRAQFEIVTTIYVDFIDAMIGVNKQVPTIDGKLINLRVHAGMNPGQHIQVPDQGMWRPDGKRGNMIVEVVMEQPVLNNSQIEQLSRIKDLK